MSRGTSWWRRRGVAPFLVGSAVGNTGVEITGIALPLLAITVLEASNAWVATIEAAVSVVMLVVALPTGLLVDRSDRRRLLVGSNLVGGVLLGLVLVLWALGELTVLTVLVVAVSLQVIGSVIDLTTDTVAPALVDDVDVDRVNGVYASSRSVAEVGGAGAGGALISLLGMAAGLAVTVATYLVSAVLMTRLPRGRLAPEPAPPQAVTALSPPVPRGRGGRVRRTWEELASGFGVYRGDPCLVRLLASSVTSNVFSTMAAAVELLFLVRVLEVPAWGVGAAVSVTAVGGLVGGLVNTPLVRLVGPVRVVVVSQLVLNLPVLLLPLASPGTGVAFYLVGWFFYSMSSVVYASAVISYRQRTVPAELLGRVGATGRWVNALAVGLTSVLTATVLTVVGLWPVVLVSSIGIYCSGLWLLSPRFLRPDAEVRRRAD